MKTSVPNATYVLPRWLRGWEQFWFTPADPAVLAVMRVTCGLVVLYTFFAYSFTLQPAFMGEDAWLNLHYRLEVVRDRPVNAAPLSQLEYTPIPPPTDEFQTAYYNAYLRNWGSVSPAPYPKNWGEANQLEEFRKEFHVDLRAAGLPIPRNEEEWATVYERLYRPRGKRPAAGLSQERGGRRGRRLHSQEAAKGRISPALRPRHEGVLALFPRHRSQHHGRHPQPHCSQRVSVHHRLLHAADLGVHLVRLALLHPSQSERAVRRRHDDDDPSCCI